MSQTSDVQDFLGNTVNQAVVRITGNQGSQGINGFLFDIVGDEELQFDSEVTDHYIETNSSIQDHIALRPRKYTLSGFVGELNDVLAQNIINALTTITGVSIVSPYMPTFSTQATQVYTQAATVAQQASTMAQNVVNSANGIYSLFSGAATYANRQQAGYLTFLRLWQDQRLSNLNLCTVETPWDTLYNMAIENVRIVQKDASNMVSEFSVTFKEMRFVDTNVTYQNPSQSIGTQGTSPNFTQADPVANASAVPSANGGTSGAPNDINNVPVSVANQLSPSFSLVTSGYGGNVA